MDIPAQPLPDPLPQEPFTLAAEWLDQAMKDVVQPNPNSMVLASVDAQGHPSARVVLCKELLVGTGGVVFYTNYESRKGRELDSTGHAAAVFHWDYRHRQVRIEGNVERLPASVSDAYFASRPWQSRLGAWASRQSQPIGSLAQLRERVRSTAQHFDIPYEGPGTPEPAEINVEIPRPLHWGGYVLVACAVELWVEGPYRIHERVRWTRTGRDGEWSHERLQP
ncbi:MAG: pyridoxamine 5'-phosphate oxidase [Proteobacteria bacterium]|nr:pyridoxamine 5'-phosphate oxidase [Pseudomonadota bacterium]